MRQLSDGGAHGELAVVLFSEQFDVAPERLGQAEYVEALPLRDKADLVYPPPLVKLRLAAA